MLKWIGITVILLSCAAFGNFLALQMKRRAATLETCRLMIGRFESEIRYNHAELGGIIHTLSEEPCMENLLFIKSCRLKLGRMDFYSAWEEALRLNPCSLCRQDMDVLCSFARQAGTSDIETQLTQCRYYEEQLDRRAEEAKMEYEKKGKLYRSLGVSLGLLAAILMI